MSGHTGQWPHGTKYPCALTHDMSTKHGTVTEQTCHSVIKKHPSYGMMLQSGSKRMLGVL